jgi:hypothetical protein
MDKRIDQCIASLRGRRMDGIYAENADRACQVILERIPRDAVVGFGDSVAVRQIGIVERLEKRGTKVFDGFKIEGTKLGAEEGQSYHDRMVKESTLCDVFIAGTNALTLDGRLVNVDCVGSRVAGMFWGHPLSIIVVGRNKIVRDLEEAFQRVRKIIAPNHVRIRAVELGGKPKRTPCVETGECSDCLAPDRICNIFTIIEGKPLYTRVNVVIVDDDLGLGWDPSWPESRIEKIREAYKKYAWLAGRNFK